MEETYGERRKRCRDREGETEGKRQKETPGETEGKIQTESQRKRDREGSCTMYTHIHNGRILP